MYLENNPNLRKKISYLNTKVHKRDGYASKELDEKYGGSKSSNKSNKSSNKSKKSSNKSKKKSSYVSQKGGAAPTNQLISDTGDGAATFTNIVNILASTKDSDLKDVETGESIAKEMDGIIISNALIFDPNGLSLPQQFQSNPKIKEAIFKMNEMRKEKGLERVSTNFQSPDVKGSEKKQAQLNSQALFKELSGKNGISKFDKALKTVQTQLKRENLSKILFEVIPSEKSQ